MDRTVAEPAAASPGDREQAVDPPEAGHGRGDRRVDLGLDREVGGRPGGRRAQRRELVGERPGMLGGPRHDDHRGPFGGEPPGARGGDPGRTRDQADPVPQALHQVASAEWPGIQGMARSYALAARVVAVGRPIDGPPQRVYPPLIPTGTALRQRFRAHHPPGPPITRR